MIRDHILRLHWKLFFPLVGMLWLIIGITLFYSASHETRRQKGNLENRLLNVNNTVIDAYERGEDLNSTVDFIRLFTDNTTLDPLQITVYDNTGTMVADNPEATISIFGPEGKIKPEMQNLWDHVGNAVICDMPDEESGKLMISSKTSADGKIRSFAALPYNSVEVSDFMAVDPMVWIVVVFLGLISSLFAFLGVRAVCRNVYTLQDFAKAVSSGQIPDDVEEWHFSNDELGDVSHKLLNVYREKIHAQQEKMNHERQIAMNISHELKTPVGIIKGYLDCVLNDKTMPDEIREQFLTRAQQNTDRLTSLVSDVGMVMRLQEQGVHIPLTTIPFNKLLVRLEEDARQGHIAEGMDLIIDVPTNCFIVGHESLLTNAMLNLVYNAAQYSQGTEMAVRWLGKKDGFHHFEFTDNGTGVPPEHIGRLFDLFYRVDSGRSRKVGGSGLGLPLVRRIITAMGGVINVENGKDGGLRFTFTLPVATPE